MNITNPETIIFLLLKKNDEYGFRQNTEFLPKGASIVAVLVKSADGVTCINQGVLFNERFLTSGPLPKYAPFAAATYFGKLWSLGVDPSSIVSVLNGGRYLIGTTDDNMSSRVLIAFDELRQGLREIPGEFERTMR